MGVHLKKISGPFLGFLESLITTKSWWDTVDWLAPNACASIFQRAPELRDEYVYLWIDSNDIWLQRSALIFQLKYREHTDFDQMADFILRKIGNKEFFIQKACGWALRQYSKYNPETVKSFIDEHPELSNLARKEGLKWLSRKP